MCVKWKLTSPIPSTPPSFRPSWTEPFRWRGGSQPLGEARAAIPKCLPHRKHPTWSWACLVLSLVRFSYFCHKLCGITVAPSVAKDDQSPRSTPRLIWSSSVPQLKLLVEAQVLSPVLRILLLPPINWRIWVTHIIPIMMRWWASSGWDITPS